MRKKIHQLGVFCLLFIGCCVQAQEYQEQRGEKQMNNYAYTNAISIYERIAQRGYETPKLLENLGNAYYFNGKLKQAHYWYARLIEQKLDIPSEFYYRYAQTLKAIGNYQLADQYLALFKSLEITDQRSLLWDVQQDYLNKIKQNSDRFTLKMIPINSSYSDFGVAINEGKLIFSSARNRIATVRRTHSWTGESFTSMFQADIGNEGTLGKPKLFAKELRSKYNESTPVFTADGETIYFTRNNYNKRLVTQEDTQNILLKIYTATKIKGKWTKAVEVPFNLDFISTAHPALTTDGKWLYFASDRGGNKSQSDLYKVAIHSDGTYGTPVNLGNQINTPGRESFPFISGDNELYFSSDGHPGLGGLDIFVTKINDDGSYGTIQNIGAPANSGMDDFAFYINAETRNGFLSSNRPAKLEGDNIYSFVENSRLSLECIQSIIGKVVTKNTQLPLENAEVTLYDNALASIDSVKTTSKGDYCFENLKCGKTYKVKVLAANYNTAELVTTLPLETGITEVDFGLENREMQLKTGDDLFKLLRLKPIYFDFDQAIIRQDAVKELIKVVEILEAYPQITITVHSHTDSRGSALYNLKLSEQRAQATVSWIVAQGVEEKRVNAIGCGEKQLMNRCKEGVNCTPKEHKQNRRSEFVINN